MSFHVGQKVECVDDAPSHPPHPLVKGRTYFIEGFDLETVPGQTGIVIAGVSHPRSLWYDGPWGFRPERFRPIVERNTSIAIFTRMLTPNKERVS